MRAGTIAATLIAFVTGQTSFAQYHVTTLATEPSVSYQNFHGGINNEGEVVLDPVPGFASSVVWLPHPNHSYSAGFNPISYPSGWTPYGWVTSVTNDHLDIVGGAQPPNAGPGVASVVAQFGDPFPGYPAGFNALHSVTTPIPIGINNLHQVLEAPDWGWTIWLPSPAYGLPAGTSGISPNGVAAAINNSGQIVGGIYGSGSGLGPGDEAAIWLPSVAFGLPQGFNPIGPTGSFATALNDNGQAAVNLDSQTPTPTAAIWLPTNAFGLSAGLHTIGPTNSKAVAINANGQVIGIYTDNGITHGFLWDPTTGFADLNALIDPTPGITIQNALGINNSSEILATGTYGSDAAVFLLSLPEPATLLLPAAFATILSLRRRRPA